MALAVGGGEWSTPRPRLFNPLGKSSKYALKAAEPV
jgi:hypothetical protein